MAPNGARESVSVIAFRLLRWVPFETIPSWWPRPRPNSPSLLDERFGAAWRSTWPRTQDPSPRAQN